MVVRERVVLECVESPNIKKQRTLSIPYHFGWVYSADLYRDGQGFLVCAIIWPRGREDNDQFFSNTLVGTGCRFLFKGCVFKIKNLQNHN